MILSEKRHVHTHTHIHLRESNRNFPSQLIIRDNTHLRIVLIESKYMSTTRNEYL